MKTNKKPNLFSTWFESTVKNNMKEYESENVGVRFIEPNPVRRDRACPCPRTATRAVPTKFESPCEKNLKLLKKTLEFPVKKDYISKVN